MVAPIVDITPVPNGGPRKDHAESRRTSATALAAGRPCVTTKNNGDHNRFSSLPTSFHKGLPHDRHGGLSREMFETLAKALNRGDTRTPQFDVPLGPENAPGKWPGRTRYAGAVPTFFTTLADETGRPRCPGVRNWESPLGGHAYDLEGPDAGSVGMAPAPALGSDELTAEMGEVYAMALLRDLPFAALATDGADTASPPVFDTGGDPSGSVAYTLGDVHEALAGLPWFDTGADPVSSEGGTALNVQEDRRRRARLDGGAFTVEAMFRGSAPGAKVGPYLSQFMLMGSTALRGGRRPAAGIAAARGIAESGGVDGPGPDGVGPDTVGPRDPRSSAPMALHPALARLAEQEKARPRARGIAEGGDAVIVPSVAGHGQVTYGAQTIHQRISAQRPGRDYMTDWPLWLDVQNGADMRDAQAFFHDGVARFVHTPRALATYVHFDELYQAYFVAGLLMLDGKVPFDHGFPSGPYHATRGSFATFGGPHILSLMTEVASRALKAVRRQKFQHHLRGRPEQLAAMITLACSDQADEAFKGDAPAGEALRRMAGDLGPLLDLVAKHNKAQNTARENHGGIFPRRAAEAMTEGGETTCDVWSDAGGFEIAHDRNFLLPMAFPEGSPMHASYGAGHATVAGACVTVLKAFFEMSTFGFGKGAQLLETPMGDPAHIAHNADAMYAPRGFCDTFEGLADHLFVPPSSDLPIDHEALAPSVPDPGVTLEGELNKLAANISIGRNMAGVHFYTDYYDSLRLGERVAVGILQEQMATYPEAVTMRLTSFDDDKLVISGDGKGDGCVHLVENKALADADAWWTRHAG